jgi:hypothetical protein
MYNPMLSNSKINDNQLSEIQRLLFEDNLLHLDTLESELIQRLVKKYPYHELMGDKKNYFKDLILLFDSDPRENRLEKLKNPDIQPILSTIVWSAYKYAQLLQFCKGDKTTLQANDILKNIEGLRMVDEEIQKIAIEDILQPSLESPEHHLDLHYFACQKYEQDRSQNTSSRVFTDRTDFHDIVELIQTFNRLYSGYWPEILAHQDLDRLLESVQHMEDVEVLIFMIDNSTAVLTLPGVMEAILERLPLDERWKIVEENADMQACYHKLIKRGEGEALLDIMGTCPDNVEAETVKSINAQIGMEEEKQESETGNQTSYQNAENDAEEKIKAEFPASINGFADLINQLKRLKYPNLGYMLVQPALQESLRKIHWSAYKYATLISVIEAEYDAWEEPRADRGLRKLPGFQDVNPLMSQTAIIEIIYSDEVETYGYGLFEIACKALCQVIDEETEEDKLARLDHPEEETDLNLIFTHADDFESVERIFQALNILPIAYWPKIFSLPDIHKHFTFSFNNANEMMDLVNTLEQESDRQFFLSLPNMLEALLAGLPHEERWKAIASDEYIKNAFIERIGQGRGDKVLDLLGDEPAADPSNMYSHLAVTVVSLAVPDAGLPTVFSAVTHSHMITLGELEPNLIRRLLENYDYHDLLADHDNYFQDLLILLRADSPENRIARLAKPENRDMLSRIFWGSYNYAQLLDLCQRDDITCSEANDRILLFEDGSSMVNEDVRTTALNDIIKPNQEQAYGLDMLYFACQKFEQDCSHGYPMVFTGRSDFPDIETLLHALNMISIKNWEKMFVLDNFHPLLESQYEDIEDMEDLLNILEDEDRRLAFLTSKGVMEALLSRLSQEDRWLIVEENPEFQECYSYCIKQESGQALLDIMGTCPDNVEAETVKSINATIKIETEVSINEEMQQSVTETQASGSVKDNEEIKLDPEFQLPLNGFRDLIATIQRLEYTQHVAFLSQHTLQDSLKNIHWSAYKYAMLLSLSYNSPTSLNIYHAIQELPFFQDDDFLISQTAFFDILLSDEQESYGYGLFEIACKAYCQEIEDNYTEEEKQDILEGTNGNTDPNLIFTHADDFDSAKQVIQALNILPLDHWSKILKLPGMDTHLKFSFDDVNEMIDLIRIFDQESDRKYFLSLPNMLEALLTGLPREERWKAIAMDEDIQYAFSERIGQGRGDKVLDLLGENPFAETPDTLNSDSDVSITFVVHSAAKEGFEKLNETQGLSSAQCRQLHFFSPQKPHPFLEKLERNLEKRNAITQGYGHAKAPG